MKKIYITIIILISFCKIGLAQSDTIYIIKAGVVIGKYNVNSQVDSIIFHQPNIQNENSFIDLRDYNVYQTVTIGNQVWMAENLRYLPSVSSPSISSITTPCYYVYDYDGSNVNYAKTTTNYNTYGVLYNWAAAMAGYTSSSTNPSGVQGVCPAGWHLPSESEWDQLSTFLGGMEFAGGKLKETGTLHWTAPNEGATNESGFWGLPSGSLYYDNMFYGLGNYGFWWSSTEWIPQYPNYRSLLYNSSGFGSDTDSAELGFSVRCVKN